MDRTQFQSIVADYEKKAARSPRLYRIAVTSRALLGSFFLHLIIAVSLALIAAAMTWITVLGPKLISKKHHETSLVWFDILAGGVILAGLYGLVFAVRAISFKFEPVRGIEIKRDAGPLWQAIDDIRNQIGRPMVHHVLIVNDLTAALVQHPRSALLMTFRNYLIIGAPLMLGMTPDQFKSVIAHELGHLTREHGRLASWIYRLHRLWDRILTQTEKRPGHPLARFIKWYQPRFSAQSFVLRRQQEFEADKIAAGVAGLEPTGDALILTYLRESQYNNFWDELWRQANYVADPPDGALEQMRTNFAALPDEDELRAELGGSLARRTSEFDSHPSLADRLDAIGYLQARGVRVDQLRGSPREIAGNLPLPRFSTPSAAEFFLGDQCQNYLARVSAAWQVDVAENWDQRHNQLLRNRGKLHLLDERAAAGKLDGEGAFERAMIVEAMEGDDKLIDLLDTALALDPSHPVANYHKGRALLRKRDPAGVELIESAIRAEPESVHPGLNLLYEFHQKQNNHDEAARIIRRADEHDRALATAQGERTFLRSDESWSKVELAASERRRLISVARSLPDVRRVYLFRRALRIFPHKPAVAIVVTLKNRRWKWFGPKNLSNAVSAEFINRVQMKIPPNVFVLENIQSARMLLDRLQLRADLLLHDADVLLE